jgi:hypothetical protein
VALLQSAQGDTWTRAMHAVAQLPAAVSAEEVDTLGGGASTALVEFGVRLESVGYMVYSRLVSLETVDDLIGGVILMFWSRAKDWGHARARCGPANPKLFEWCEWMADRIVERRATRGHEPAHIKHRNWRGT